MILKRHDYLSQKRELVRVKTTWKKEEVRGEVSGGVETQWVDRWAVGQPWHRRRTGGEEYKDTWAGGLTPPGKGEREQ